MVERVWLSAILAISMIQTALQALDVEGLSL
jgi:hypothetical protein